MKVYLVGGAVRDQLLGREVRERDWVVVGARPEDLKQRGYRPVGQDFPVFLHPETHEEYALARTERKTGRGYHGFAFHASPEVTLEQDLARRDLTINAMARADDGTLIDPYDGRRDLEQRLLRHVSPAFAEDPVRILRLARFAARFQPLGFRVAPETLALCRKMVADGEVDALVPERVWQELSRALLEDTPVPFFRVLRECGALARVLPELDRLFGIPEPEAYHPEGDTGEHTLLALAQSARLGGDLPVRWAVLLHDLGKATTPSQVWPRHPAHEHRGVPLVEALCERLRAPRECRDLARLVCRYHLQAHRAFELRASTLLKLLEGLDLFRRQARLEPFLLACEADARGRLGLEDQPYPQARFLREAYRVAAAVTARPFVQAGFKGRQIAEAVTRERIRALAALQRDYPRPEAH
ncbi:multifunctional CCA addition/repair protein [Alkalilimnicola ehrlichii MLHE-1]|uniref:Multifunctional CCA protein n=1 Tax=Alkalilimnicola ehrlichii (strain ATCC BAA-1101 / DSM 17681 / MLHE-1) TaxID=187272 RepID=CCA_ALKEH|nr:multifunctional CCA addition/repair protein [Alkalilimnicola ehrlichii]Q0ACP8.1 RecName: Full=Multifunctional CCA protein; Includes: RecName: Full=CCA-adding enzyme; AltName: Full=CCA tRNA nucleotidyltransferase; AltName: Full=tRNA CCA-pyrophosphorylase; AltName: Full=tRNA adenylyl-/cytidylyl-transferase; AltName: Full=tRNA nucleotidyltransferase; AltName: Full=tRNA-NT; Includes: RecName: Full=2'-nucleotidase; Includes: RecName: Full=2',3'-cyclic phosphodiesterase; Includes: RecName: Full=Phosp